jgi:hypothetical protein
MKPCGDHLLIPGLILFADPVDAGDTWIEFQNQSDGARWRHGSDKGEWTTEELMRTPGPMVGNPAIEAAKKGLGATVAKVEPKWTTPESLVEQYPPEDSRRVWDGPEDGIEAAMTTLGIPQEAQPDRLFNDERHRCFEFKIKTGDFLLVQYEGTGIAAIWKGVE